MLISSLEMLILKTMLCDEELINFATDKGHSINEAAKYWYYPAEIKAMKHALNYGASPKQALRLATI